MSGLTSTCEHDDNDDDHSDDISYSYTSLDHAPRKMKHRLHSNVIEDLVFACCSVVSTEHLQILMLFLCKQEVIQQQTLW